MGVRYFCDGCDVDVEDDFTDLTKCAGDCFKEFCDDCLKPFGGDRYCEQCYEAVTKDIPGAEMWESPLFNPRVIEEWQWPWQKEEAEAVA